MLVLGDVGFICWRGLLGMGGREGIGAAGARVARARGRTTSPSRIDEGRGGGGSRVAEWDVAEEREALEWWWWWWLEEWMVEGGEDEEKRPDERTQRQERNQVVAGEDGGEQYRPACEGQ